MHLFSVRTISLSKVVFLQLQIEDIHSKSLLLSQLIWYQQAHVYHICTLYFKFYPAPFLPHPLCRFSSTKSNTYRSLKGRSPFQEKEVLWGLWFGRGSAFFNHEKSIASSHTHISFSRWSTMLFLRPYKWEGLLAGVTFFHWSLIASTWNVYTTNL